SGASARMSAKLTAMTTRKVSHQGCGRSRRWRPSAGRFAGVPPLGTLVTRQYWHSEGGAGNCAPSPRGKLWIDLVQQLGNALQLDPGGGLRSRSRDDLPHPVLTAGRLSAETPERLASLTACRGGRRCVRLHGS